MTNSHGELLGIVEHPIGNCSQVVVVCSLLLLTDQYRCKSSPYRLMQLDEFKLKGRLFGHISQNFSFEWPEFKRRTESRALSKTGRSLRKQILELYRDFRF